MKTTYKFKHWFNADNEIELIPCVDVGLKKPKPFKTEDIFPNLNYTFTNSLALNKDYL